MSAHREILLSVDSPHIGTCGCRYIEEVVEAPRRRDP
jgi:hypothetical protein